MLSIILTGLGLISVIQNLWSIEVVSIPELILTSYKNFRDVLFEYIFEWWVPFSIPSFIKDFITLYAFCSLTVYNYYKINGVHHEYGRLNILLKGPWLIVASVMILFDEEAWRKTPQYMLFWLGHVIAVIVFCLVAVVFFLWNYFSIESL